MRLVRVVIESVCKSVIGALMSYREDLLLDVLFGSFIQFLNSQLVATFLLLYSFAGFLATVVL